MNDIDRNRCLPISEDFHSLQGEGRYTGTPMHFIRLAGCSVGEAPKSSAEDDLTFPILKTGNTAWLCHTYDGRPFWCDTDFKFRHWTNFTNLLDDTWERHICLTGGEPLMHLEKVERFVEEAEERDVKIHIETSGTVGFFPSASTWVSVSPKRNVIPGMIETADEIKLLVDADFNLATVPPEVRDHPLVYIQPINDELMVSRANFERCMEILRLKPEWNLSVQTHKLLGLQ